MEQIWQQLFSSSESKNHCFTFHCALYTYRESGSSSTRLGVWMSGGIVNWSQSATSLLKGTNSWTLMSHLGLGNFNSWLNLGKGCVHFEQISKCWLQVCDRIQIQWLWTFALDVSDEVENCNLMCWAASASVSALYVTECQPWHVVVCFSFGAAEVF